MFIVTAVSDGHLIALVMDKRTFLSQRNYNAGLARSIFVVEVRCALSLVAATVWTSTGMRATLVHLGGIFHTYSVKLMSYFQFRCQSYRACRGY